MHTKITSALKISTLAIVFSFGLSYVYAWTAPLGVPPTGNVSAPINTSATAQVKAGDFTAPNLINTSATNQVKAGDIAINGATNFLDTGTTIPATPAGGTGAVALNGWPNFSDVAANAVKLAGLTSADILSAQTAGGVVTDKMTLYGTNVCPTGWTTAVSGRTGFVYMGVGLATAVDGLSNTTPTVYTILCLAGGATNLGGFNSATTNPTCAVCVR